MELKPIAERTNLPLIAAFVVWVLAILVMPYSHAAYMLISYFAMALFMCQLAFNVRLRRAKAS